MMQADCEPEITARVKITRRDGTVEEHQIDASQLSIIQPQPVKEN